MKPISYKQEMQEQPLNVLLHFTHLLISPSSFNLLKSSCKVPFIYVYLFLINLFVILCLFLLLMRFLRQEHCSGLPFLPSPGYFCLCRVFIAVRGPSLAAASEATLIAVPGFSLLWLHSLQSTGCQHISFSSCGLWSQQLWCVGVVAPRHVKSSQIRDHTHVSCKGRWSLHHWALRKSWSCQC